MPRIVPRRDSGASALIQNSDSTKAAASEPWNRTLSGNQAQNGSTT